MFRNSNWKRAVKGNDLEAVQKMHAAHPFAFDMNEAIAMAQNPVIIDWMVDNYFLDTPKKINQLVFVICARGSLYALLAVATKHDLNNYVYDIHGDHFCMYVVARNRGAADICAWFQQQWPDIYCEGGKVRLLRDIHVDVDNSRQNPERLTTSQRVALVTSNIMWGTIGAVSVATDIAYNVAIGLFIVAQLKN